MILREVMAVLGGFVIGILSGVTGLGGGVLLVPLLVLGFGFRQHLAQGTSLVAIIPTALVGAYAHWREGNLDRSGAVWLGGTGAVAAVAGALLAVHMPRDILARLFGLLLLFAAYRMWRPVASK